MMTRLTAPRLTERTALVCDVLDRIEYVREDIRIVLDRLRTFGTAFGCEELELAHGRLVDRIMTLEGADLDRLDESGDTPRLALVRDILEAATTPDTDMPLDASLIPEVINTLREYGSLDDSCLLEIWDYHIVRNVMRLTAKNIDQPASLRREGNRMLVARPEAA